MNFCLIGAPGVGKGTFSKLLIKRLKLHHISVGDIIRNEIILNSDVGMQARQYVDRGDLIPDEVVNRVVFQEVRKQKFANILLDGFPRNTEQARYLDDHLPSLRAVSIQLDRGVAAEKLLGRRICTGCGRSFNTADIDRDGYVMPAILPGDYATCPLGADECQKYRNLQPRSDDTQETIMRRFEVFEVETAPLVSYYAERNRLRTFDVKRGVDDIDDLIRVMES